MSTETVGMAGDSRPILDIYGRVSRLTDKRMRSVEGQLKDCRVRVGDYGAEVGEVLADPGRSAWNPKVKRPAWDALMERLASGVSQGVCVFDLSRFSRRPIEGERLIEIAESGLVVLDTEREFDLTSPDGKSSFRDQMKMAAYYSDRLSTTSRRGKRTKAMNGEPVGPHRAFGFEPDGVTLRMAEVEVMRKQVRRLLGHDDEPRWSLEDVVADLNEQGILTTSGPCPKHDGSEKRVCLWCGRKKATLGDHAGTWQGTTLKAMLLKECNIGEVKVNGETLGRIPGDPIFDADTWADLTALFAARRRGRPASEVYVCSGIAVCGLCWHPLTGRTRPGVDPYSDGEVRRQYWCQLRRNRKKVGKETGCARISVDQRALDEHVKALAATILSSPKHAAQIEAAAKARKALDDKRAKLEDKIADLDDMANVLSGRLGRGEMPLERYDTAVEPLETRLAELRAELAKLDEQRASKPKASAREVKASREAWEKRWDAATTDERRSLLRRALKGRALVVGPAVKPGPFNSDRVTVEPRRRKK